MINLHSTLCMRAVKALASLCLCSVLPEPYLLTNAISTEISCTGPYYYAL